MPEQKFHHQELSVVEEHLSHALSHHSALLVRACQNHRIHLYSNASYGTFSLIESEHYQIKGQLQQVANDVLLTYRVYPNATFQTLGIVIPIFALPTILIPLLSEDAANRWLGLFFYVAIVIVSLIWTTRSTNKLRHEGEKAFEQLLTEVGDQIQHT